MLLKIQWTGLGRYELGASGLNCTTHAVSLVNEDVASCNLQAGETTIGRDKSDGGLGPGASEGIRIHW